jgi:hypothetical protein
MKKNATDKCKYVIKLSIDDIKSGRYKDNFQLNGQKCLITDISDKPLSQDQIKLMARLLFDIIVKGVN